MKMDVVVTGLGVVSPLGNDPETLWNALLRGESAAAPVSRFDASEYPVRIAAEVDDAPLGALFSPKETKRLPRFVRYGVAAALRCLENAGLKPSDVDPDRAGAMVGSGLGGMDLFMENMAALRDRGPSRVSPFFIPGTIVNSASGEISLRTGWRGPNWSVVSACASGNHAIMAACDQIRAGRADVMLAGASEEGVSPVALSGFCAMRALSARNDDPARASRPFDRDRDGFLLGEGAAALCLESADHARARGARPLAVLAGCGASADAWHPAAPRPDGAGALRAMRAALRDAGLEPGDVDVVNAHGTSTPAGDLAEGRALVELFGERQPVLNATKAMLGHALGASSALEAVVSVLTLRDGKVHPSVNLDRPEFEGILRYAPPRAEALAARTVLSNGFGFGGHNSSLLFARV